MKSEPPPAPALRCNLRVASPADAAGVAAIYAPHVADEITSFELQPPTAADMQRRIGETLQTHPWLVAERGGELLGYAYACAHRSRAAYQWSVDTAVYLRAEAQGQGLGRRLYARLFAILCSQGYVNAYAGIALPNERSVRLHETMGFEAVGVYRQVGFKLGAPRDVGWWQLRLQPWPLEPVAPQPFSALAGNA